MNHLNNTLDWLKALGAKRPQAATNQVIIVIGDQEEGFYPIEYKQVEARDIDGNKSVIEQWSVFGIETKRQLTREDCERIIRICTND